MEKVSRHYTIANCMQPKIYTLLLKVCDAFCNDQEFIKDIVGNADLDFSEDEVPFTVKKYLSSKGIS